MSNKNPVHTQHWTKARKDGIKLHTMEVLWYAVEEKPNGITSKDVSKEFNIPLAEAASRLLALYKWGFLSVKVPSVGGKGNLKVYYVNDNGIDKHKDKKQWYEKIKNWSLKN
jgi:hypothetical protein